MAEPNQPSRPVLPGEDIKAVSMREFEQRLGDLKALLITLIAHEVETRETITMKLEEARNLQAEENKRRLEELNHAHKTATENWARTLPRELFEQWKSDHDKWRESVNISMLASASNAQNIAQMQARLKTIEDTSQRITGAFILLGIMGMSGVAALVLGLARLVGAIG